MNNHDVKSAVDGRQSYSPYRHYIGYEAWKGWANPFTFTKEEAEYFSGEFNGIPLAGKDMLEIGFGPGNLLAWARAAGANVAGTEVNPVLLDAARRNAIPILAVDLERAVVGHRGRFDVVVAIDVFEHFTRDEVDAALRAVDEMLRPGGYLVLRFPNGQSPFGLLPQNGDVTHRTALSKDIIEQLCRETGLRAIRYRGSYRVRGPLGLTRAVRRLRALARDMLGAILNSVYAFDIPWDSVVVLVMRKET
jgi:2-polyprenyl-3-methyl-5-hydroxy-6-metoxy-1,4-benzoquinol methylase